MHRGHLVVRCGPSEDRGRPYAGAPSLKEGLAIRFAMKHRSYHHSPFRRMRNGGNGLGGESGQSRIDGHRVPDDEHALPTSGDDLPSHAAGRAEARPRTSRVRPSNLHKRLRGRDSRRGLGGGPERKNQLPDIGSCQEGVPVRSESRVRNPQAGLERASGARKINLAALE
jgi:hypothetical protein